MNTSSQRPSLINRSNSDIDEEKLISEVLTTSYDKVMKILLKAKKFIEDNENLDLANELSWAIEKVQTHTLYTYEFSDHTMELEKYGKNSPEIQSFFHYIQNYSETDHKRRNKVSSRTVKENCKTVLSPETIKQVVRKSNKDVSSFLKKKSSFLINNEDEQEEEDEGIKSIVKKSSFLRRNSTNLEGTIKTYIKLIETNMVSDDKIIDYDFDIFKFEILHGRHEVFPRVCKHVITYFSSNLDSYTLENFLVEIRDAYVNTNPYHNSMHGADVCQTIGLFFDNSNVITIVNLSEIDILSVLVAAAVHDVGHPGTNNTFQINSHTDLAIIYNDKSILENFHLAQTFKILKKETCNIFSIYNNTDFKYIRRRIIEAVLSTDMICHAKVVSQMKNRVQNKSIINYECANNFEEEQEIINFLVHAADISHCTKKFEISYNWTNLVSEEFWRQGDEEKKLGLPISFLCDRNNTDIPKSQIGFIKGIIIPTFDLLVDFLPDLSHLKENVDINLNIWSEKANKTE
jgi:hypothetical protein